jgi:L-amino acid N-acyltransferase YncA
MHIRLMRAGDCGDIAGVLNRSIEHGVAHFGTKLTDEREVHEDWARTREYLPWLVATSSDGAFMGFAKASTWKTRNAYDWTVESGVYIVDDAQGQGVGRALYTRLFEILREQGYRTVLAGVSIPNAGSEQLHERMGFRNVGDIDPAGYKLGQWVAVRLYQLMLDDLKHTPEPGAICTVEEALERIGERV